MTAAKAAPPASTGTVVELSMAAKAASADATATVPTKPSGRFSSLGLIRVLRQRYKRNASALRDVLLVLPEGIAYYQCPSIGEIPEQLPDSLAQVLPKSRRAQKTLRRWHWHELKSVQCSKPFARGILSGISRRAEVGREIRIEPCEGPSVTVFLPYREADRPCEAIQRCAPRLFAADLEPRMRGDERAPASFAAWGLGCLPMLNLVFLGFLAVGWIGILILGLTTRLPRTSRSALAKQCLRAVLPAIGALVIASLTLTGESGLLPTILAHASLYGLAALAVPNACARLEASVIAAVGPTHDPCPQRPRLPQPWFERVFGPGARHAQIRRLAWPLRMLGLAMLLAAYANPWLLTDIGSDRFAWERLLFQLTLIPAAVTIYMGYRLGQASATETIAADQRAPIVFLRSFKDDGSNSFIPDCLATSLLGVQPIKVLRTLGPAANMNPVRLVRLLFNTSGDSAEEELSAFFRTHGPFVAIGRPEEGLPTAGAARDYVDHDTWRTRVSRWIRDARAVVIQPGESLGVRWEIERALELRGTNDLLFCMVALRDRQAEYEDFALHLSRCSGVAMPSYLGNASFLWIHRGKACLAHDLYTNPMAWPLRGSVLDFQSMLGPFLSGASTTAQPRRPLASAPSVTHALIASLAWFLGIALTVGLLRHLTTVAFNRVQQSAFLECPFGEEFHEARWGGVQMSMPVTFDRPDPERGVNGFLCEKVPAIIWTVRNPSSANSKDLATAESLAKQLLDSSGLPVAGPPSSKARNSSGDFCVSTTVPMAGQPSSPPRTIRVEQIFREDALLQFVSVFPSDLPETGLVQLKNTFDSARAAPLPRLSTDFAFTPGTRWVSQACEPPLIASWRRADGGQLLLSVQPQLFADRAAAIQARIQAILAQQLGADVEIRPKIMSPATNEASPGSVCLADHVFGFTIERKDSPRTLAFRTILTRDGSLITLEIDLPGIADGVLADARELANSLQILRR